MKPILSNANAPPSNHRAADASWAAKKGQVNLDRRNLAIMLTAEGKTAIANKYRPLLVLYPEIESDSSRKKHYRSGHKKSGQPPLDQDYHPRGIELVLDNAFVPIAGKPRPSRADILDAMSNNKVEHIDLVRGAGPGSVDKFWQVYAAISEQEREQRYPRKAYARIVHGSGRYAEHLIIQYWLAYFFDDWANVHEMDWEMVSVVIRQSSENERPITCAYRAHMGGFRLTWPEVQKVDGNKNITKEGTHPVVYVANGSHACYFDYSPRHEAASTFLGPKLSRRIIKMIPWIGKTFTDYVPSFDKGEKHFPEILVIPEPDNKGHWHGEWRWLNFRGRWGAKGRLWLRPKQLLTLPWEEDGPTGPAQKGLCWEDPFASIDFECFDAGSWILSR